jgi:hypothetical protein
MPVGVERLADGSLLDGSTRVLLNRDPDLRYDLPRVMARVMARTGWLFRRDVLQCTCGGRRKVAAFIPGGKLACEILERLRVASGCSAEGPSNRL